VHIIFKK
jgi:hypothetical protein